MQQETFIIGGKEFTTSRMNAFEANRLLLRIQKIALPVIASMTGSGKNIMEADTKEAAAVISEHLDESLIDKIIFPMFADAKVYSVEDKKFIKNASDINQCFTTENLFDFYELIFEVARFQFGPFFTRLMERFGSVTGAEKKA